MWQLGAVVIMLVLINEVGLPRFTTWMGDCL